MSHDDLRDYVREHFADPGAVAAATHSAAAAPPPKTLFGTLDTQISSVGTEHRAGLSAGMFELDWASLEPKPGVFNNSYISESEHFLWKFREEKMRVTLDR